MVQTILIIVGCLAGLIVLLALINGKQMHIEQSTTINRSTTDVFEYVKYLNNHENFSVWVMADPNMKKTKTGTDGQVGYIYGWDSTNKNVGEGEQEIVEMKHGLMVRYDLRFKRPMKSEASASIIVIPSGVGSSKISWSFSGPMKFPMNALMPLMKNMLGKSLSQSLNNLKVLMEQ